MSPLGPDLPPIAMQNRVCFLGYTCRAGGEVARLKQSHHPTPRFSWIMHESCRTCLAEFRRICYVL